MVTATTAQPAALSELKLRYCGQQPSELRLRARKCTIGSDPHCTLRLRAPQVDAVHCMIIRGGERTIVRNWSPATRHNGRTFQDAVLNVGDRLKFGPWEFEVVDLGYSNETAPAPLSDAAGRHEEQWAELSRRESSLVAERLQVERQAAALRDELAETRSQADRLELERAQLDAQRTAWESASNARTQALADLDAQAAELAQRIAELETRERNAATTVASDDTLADHQRRRDREAGFGDDAAEAFPAPCQATIPQSVEPLPDDAVAFLAQLNFERLLLDDARLTDTLARAAAAAHYRHLMQFVRQCAAPATESKNDPAASSSDELEAQRTELARQANTLLEQLQLVEQQRAAWEAEQSRRAAAQAEIERQLADRAAELERFAESLREQQWSLSQTEAKQTVAGQDRALAEAPVTAAADETAASAEIDEIKARLSAELQAAEDGRRQAQSLLSAELDRLAAREREVELRAHELTERHAELERREAAAGEAVAAETSAVATAGGDAASADALAEKTQAIEQQAIELETQRQELIERERLVEQQASQVQAEKNQLLKQAAVYQQRMAELEADTVELARRRAELEDYARQSDATPAPGREGETAELVSASQPPTTPSAFADVPSLLDLPQVAAAVESVEQPITGRLLQMLKESETADRKQSGDVVESPEAGAEAPTGEAPQEDLRDMLRRIGQLPSDDERPLGTPAHEVQAALKPMPAVKSTPQQAPHEEDHDSAVQAYMAQLLMRNGGSTQAAMPSAAVDKPAMPINRPRSGKPSAQSRQESPAPVREYVRVAAPEKQTDLNALREVANLSAEAALEKFRRRKALFGVGEMLFLATSAGVGAHFILYYDAFGPSLSIYVGVGCILIALVLLGRTAKLIGRLQKMGGLPANIPTLPKFGDLLAATPTGKPAQVDVQPKAPAATTPAPAAVMTPVPTVTAPTHPIHAMPAAAPASSIGQNAAALEAFAKAAAAIQRQAKQ